MSGKIENEVLKLATKSIATSALKEKLNTFYALSKTQLALLSQKDHFDYLWDLKEKAIIEGKSTVEVPEEWFSDLDSVEAAGRSSAH